MAPGNTGNRGLNAPEATGVLDMLRRQSVTRPDAKALVGSAGAATGYGALARNIEKIARDLHGLGLGRSDRVAVVLPNGPEMATAFLATCANGVCAPLNPAYRKSEFDFLLSDLDARALLVPTGVDSPARAAARDRGIAVLEAGSDPDFGLSISGRAIGDPPTDSVGRADDLALILYTSGMTSRPKAVPLTHRSICTSAHNISVALELRPEDRCINVMPLFHAHGLVIALLSSLTAGGSVVCSRGFSAEGFYGALDTLQPTWYTAAPTIHHAVLEDAPAHRELLKRRSVRFIRSSAAFLPPSVRTGLEREFGAPVIEAYGMTECTQISSNPVGGRRTGSVGIPAGPEVGVMGERGDLLAAGETGEIVIRGPAVIREYEKNPAATHAAFSDGWFRTGDQGILSSDGFLSLTGRLKDIINIGGEKVSPSEIDEVLTSHPAVFEAVAFGVPHPTLGEDVAAAVVLRPDISATEKNLRDFAATRLADYKVPRQILIVPEIPKSPTGKLKRSGLAEALGLAPHPGNAMPSSASVAGREDSVRGRFGKIWSDLLNVESPEADANFFRSGGDSILASRLVARVRKEFRFELPLHSLFETPAFGALCMEIERGVEAALSSPGMAGGINALSARASSPLSTARRAPGVTEPKAAPAAPSERVWNPSTARDMRFSLFFFSADGSESSTDRYRLVIEASRFADRHGYAAVWTPERHFHPFGGPYPNPAVLGAAIAVVTERLQIRAASVVLPLQNPIRVAEEWAVVDNLSGGRTGVSFASGWHVNDFALWPSNYEDRRKVMFEGIRTVRDLWEGKPILARNGLGKEVSLTVFPRPIQRSLPVWLSCQSEATFRKAGELGLHAITAMYSMSLDELAQRIAAYREARERHGHDPAAGEVAVCLHTFLAEDMATVRERVKGAYLDYLLVNLGLHADRVKGAGDEFEPTVEDREYLMRKASENLFNERGLVGTVASCRERVASLEAIGVNEIACLIDFGIDFDSVMASLYQLNKLKQLSAQTVRSAVNAV
jgi:natural product biosynthesis luciferase-like monooxygenase protein